MFEVARQIGNLYSSEDQNNCNFRKWVHNLGGSDPRLKFAAPSPSNVVSQFRPIFQFVGALLRNGARCRQSKNRYETKNIPLPDSERMVYIGPLRNTWLRLIRTYLWV